MFRSKNLMKSLYNHCSKNFRNKVQSTGKSVMICSASSRSIYTIGSLMTDKQIPITFVDRNGTAHVVIAKVGDTILDVLNDNQLDIPGYGMMNKSHNGYEGECGGLLACSTCHVILKEEDFNKLDYPSTPEEDLICAVPGNCDTSRLGCQIQITEDMSGLELCQPSMSFSEILSDIKKANEEKKA